MNLADIKALIAEDTVEHNRYQVGFPFTNLYYVPALAQWIMVEAYNDNFILAQGSIEHCLDCVEDTEIQDWYDAHQHDLEYF